MNISNVQNEVLFVGSFYKKPDVYVEYGRFIKSEYDLSDEVTRFLYDNFETYYKTFSQTIDETKLNTYMSQDVERLKLYRKYGGYKTVKAWMEISDTDDFKNYIEQVKKYSLLREFHNKGYNVSKIMEHRRFNTMSANDIYRIVRSGADKIGTIILSNEDSVIVNEDNTENIKSWLITPQFGLEMPFPIINESFRGYRKTKMFAVGMLSNAGKSRVMINQMCHVAFVHGEKALCLANEMTIDDFRACVLTTVINQPIYHSLHGVVLTKREREIVMGIYDDSDGNIIERKEDEDGNFIETEQEFIDRTYKTSETFRKVCKVSEWIEKQINNKIYFKQLFDYSDDVLDFEIRKHKLVHNVEFVFYDTLKCYKDESWTVLKQTTTNLSSLALDAGVFIYASIQLNDEALHVDADQLSSAHIGSSKGLKHILDFLVLGKKIELDEYNKYLYLPHNSEWGTYEDGLKLNNKKTYYVLKIDKSRSGSKTKIPLIEVDLDFNTWNEVGQLIRAPKKKKGE